MASSADAIDYNKWAEAMMRAQKGQAGPGLNLDTSGLQKAITPTKDAFNTLKDQITANVDVWRKLSNVGANFSNDVVGMGIAAKEARMELGDFADMISKNAKNFAGLGGSVTRGVEAFSKLTKEFQDTQFAKDLMNLGYTTKEINETLALNVGFQKSSARLDKEGKQAAFDSATKLATEMDLIAKLTGKSRDEQEKALRQQQRNGEVESKMRLIGLREGADAEKAARAAYAEQYSKAEARGQGQLFQDMFTKGVPASEEAATQLALTGEAGKETAAAAKALGKGLTDEANAAQTRADAANAKLQNDPTYLTLGALGPSLAGTAGTVAKAGVEINDALHHSVKAYADANNMVLKSSEDYAKAIAGIRADLIKSQTGIKTAPGEVDKKVSGATEGVIAAEKATKDAAAGIASSMEVANKSGKTIADSLRNVGTEIENAVKPMGNIRKRIEDAAREGITTKGKEGGVVGGGAALAKEGAEALEKPLRTGIQGAGKIFAEETPVPKKEVGGAVAPGEPVIVGDKNGKGGEIFVPKAAGDIIPTGEIKNNETKGGLDLNKMSKDIKTTVSSGSPGANVQQPMSSMAKMGLNDSQKKMFEEFEKLSSDQLNDKKAALTEEKSLQQKLNKEAVAARDAIEERLENEGKSIKDLSGEDKKRFDELTKQMNDSFDASAKASEASKVLKRLEGERRTDELFGKIQVVEEAKIAEKEKVAIIEKANEDVKQTLTAHQQTVLKYAYEDQAWQEDNAKNLLKSEQSSLLENQNKLAELEKEFEGKELNDRQKNRLEKIKGEIESNKESVKIREEELYVYQNLDKLKVKSTKETAAVVEKATSDIKENLGDAVTVPAISTVDPNKEGETTAPSTPVSTVDPSKEGKTTAPSTPVSTVDPSKEGKTTAPSTPKFPASGTIDLNKLNLPGMESFGFKAAPKDPKGTDVKAAGAAASEEAKKEEAKKAEEKKKAEEAKKASAAKPAGSAASAGTKTDKSATLDDVVKGLDKVNSTLGQLISQQADLIRKQTSTMLSAGSSNVYDKTR